MKTSQRNLIYTGGRPPGVAAWRTTWATGLATLCAGLLGLSAQA